MSAPEKPERPRQSTTLADLEGEGVTLAELAREGVTLAQLSQRKPSQTDNTEEGDDQ